MRKTPKARQKADRNLTRPVTSPALTAETGLASGLSRLPGNRSGKQPALMPAKAEKKKRRPPLFQGRRWR